jgi:hypothetical protein
MAQRTAGKEKQSEHGHRAVEKYVVTQAKQWKGECEHCDVKATGYESENKWKKVYLCVSVIKDTFSMFPKFMDALHFHGVLRNSDKQTGLLMELNSCGRKRNRYMPRDNQSSHAKWATHLFKT